MPSARAPACRWQPNQPALPTEAHTTLSAVSHFCLTCALAFFHMVCREEIELKFDRPFVFAVVHGPTGLALFAGEVYTPEAWKA